MSETTNHHITSSNIPEFVRKSAHQAALSLGFTPDRFNVTIEAGPNCNGLVGEIQQITIVEDDRKVTLFGKIPPQDPVRREQFNSMKLFEREVIFYSKLLPEMFDFQRRKEVTALEGFFNVPKCYQTLFDSDIEESLILMENLRERNFQLRSKLETLDYDHARLLMVHLGRLHGLSLAIKDQQPEVFEKFKLPDVLLPTLKGYEPLIAMFGAALDNAISLLEPEETTERSKMEALKADYMTIMETCLDGSAAEPYSVLNHGDCWTNNILFGYKDNKPTELALIDWQLIRYVSPALDILYFLYCCTDQSFRQQHLTEMLRTYHSSLSDLVNRLGSDPDQLFPFTALEDQLRQFGKFAVIMAAFDVPILCTDPEDMPTETETTDLAEAFATSPEAQKRYAHRMGGIVRDAVRFGYL